MQDNAINYILTVLMSLGLVYSLTSSLNFDSNIVIILILVLVSLAVMSIMFYNKAILIISSVILILSAVIIFLSSSSYISWLIGYIQNNVDLNYNYADITTFFLCFFITFIIYYFTVINYNFVLIAVGGIVLFSVQWALNFFVSYGSFTFFMFLILIYYFKYIYFKNFSSQRNNYFRPFKYIFMLVPLCIVILISSYTLPASTKPIFNTGAPKQISVGPGLSSFKDQPFVNFPIENITGFDDDNSKLGGKVKKDKTLVLKVFSPRVLYLKGECMQNYTGKGWRGPTNFNLTSMVTPPELLNGINILTDDGIFPTECVDRDSVTVQFYNLQTRSIFVPANTFSFSTENNENYISGSDGVISSYFTMHKKGFKYSLNAYSPQTDSQKFIDILRRSHRYIYKEYYERLRTEAIPISEKKNKIKNESNNSGGSVVIEKYNDLRIYSIPIASKENERKNVDNVILESTKLNILKAASVSKDTYNMYTQLPELPKRVKALAKNITFKYKNDYDKVKAIEQYLSTNYKYTLNPKQAPKGQDFVDYFLFDSKEGYCTYYATAMSVLTRCIGLPSRYVGGYALPPYTNKDSLYEVTNEQAHAWVEVYFEGYGWMTFEPTSPFTSDFYDTGKKETGSGKSLTTPRPQKNGSPSNVGNSSESSGDGNGISILLLVFTLVVILLSILLIVIFKNIIKARFIINKITGSSPREGVLLAYAYYLKLLSKLGLTMMPGETPLKFSVRADNALKHDSLVSFERITSIFALARYSQNEITIENLTLTLSLMESTQKEIKLRLGKLRYFTYRYLTGRLC